MIGRRGARRDWSVAGAVFMTVLLAICPDGTAVREMAPEVRADQTRIKSHEGHNPAFASLTAEEIAWIREHPSVRVGIQSARPPYELVDQMGRYSGIAADYLKLIEARLGIVMEIQSDLSREQALARMESRELDMLPALSQTPERSRILLFTRPYIRYTIAIVTRLEHADIDSLPALSGRNVALVKGHSSSEIALASQPDIIPVFVDNALEGLNKVSNGEADAIVGDLPSLSYKIAEYSLLNLRVSGIAPFETEGLRIGVRKDWPVLVSILDKVLASITLEEHQEIRRRWVTLEPPERMAIELSPEERKWLADHPVIRNAADPAWSPIELIDEQGLLKGFTSEYLSLFERMLGVKFETPTEMSWAQMLEALKDGRLDMASCVRETPQRRSFMILTEPYFSMPTAIFTRTDVTYADLTSLKGRRVAVVEGHALQDLISEEYPEIQLVPVVNLEKGLTLLSRGEVYAYVDALAPGAYGITYNRLSNIHIVGETPFRYEMSMAAAKAHPLLASILQKALRAVPESDRDRFFQKWAALPIAYRRDYSLAWKVLAGGAIVLLIAAFWNRRLSREISGRRRVEAALLQAKEELELRVEERTAELEARNAALADEIVERRRAEDALRESEERFFKAFTLSPAPMVISEIDSGRFIDVNEQWLRMMEHLREETVGCTSYDLGMWEDPEARVRLGKRLQETGSFRDEPIRFITKSGKIKDALWSAEKVVLGGSEVMLSLVYDFSERKKAEDALQAKTEELNRFFSVALDLLCIADTDGRFRRLNPQWQALLGYTTAELEGKRFIDLVHPEDREATLAELRRLYGQEPVLNFTNRYRCRDGSYRWIEWRSFPAGSRIYAAARDITERRQAEEALRQSEDLLRRSQSVARLGSYRLDIHTGEWIGSPTLDELFGIDEHYARDVHGWISLVHPEDRQAMREYLQVHVIKEHNRFEKEYRIRRRRDGQERWVLGRGELGLDDAGNPECMIGTVQDITERKRAEIALRESEERLRLAITAANQGLYDLNVQTGEVTVSPEYATMLGYDPTTFQETSEAWIERLHPDDRERVAAAYRDCLSGRQTALQMELRQRTAKGEWKWILSLGKIVEFDGAGRPLRILGTHTDITARKQAEDELRESLEEKESLLKEVHHRVKNNLQVISSLLKLQSRKVQNAELSGFLRDTQNRIHSMALLHESLYRSSNLAHVRFPQYVKNVCTHVARSYASGTADIRLLHDIVDVTLDLDLAIPAGLIISELVSNAFKHAFPSEATGEILVELQDTAEKSLVLRVSDNGTGLSAEIDPLKTETLGLLLVRSLARQLDGRMSVNREKGTVFEIVLPAQHP